MGPGVGLDILEKRKICGPYLDLNPGTSSPHPSRYEICTEPINTYMLLTSLIVRANFTKSTKKLFEIRMGERTSFVFESTRGRRAAGCGPQVANHGRRGHESARNTKHLDGWSGSPQECNTLASICVYCHFETSVSVPANSLVAPC